jgi:Zn-dependent protease with chaperone function
VFVIFVVVLWELAMLPALIYVARRVDSRYGKGGSAHIEDVLAAQAHASVVAVPAALVAAASVLVSVGVAGRWWWVADAVLLGLIFAAAMRGAPVLLAMMADTRPISRPSLVARLSALSARASVPVAGIREWVVDRESRTTALVSGLGPSRRVLLASELARHWSDDEVAVVVAHELAHLAYRDLWRAFGLNVVVLVVALFVADASLQLLGNTLHLASAAELAALPFLALVASLVWIVATPMRHAQSRRHERRADVRRSVG